MTDTTQPPAYQRKYHVYGKVEGSIYLGEFEAESEDAAKEMAEVQADVCFCHQCAKQCEDPLVTVTTAELEG